MNGVTITIIVVSLIVVGLLVWWVIETFFPKKMIIKGCMNKDFMEYNPDATEDTKPTSCKTKIVGCMDEDFMEYNANALEDTKPTSCITKFPDIGDNIVPGRYKIKSETTGKYCKVENPNIYGDSVEDNFLICDSPESDDIFIIVDAGDGAMYIKNKEDKYCIYMDGWAMFCQWDIPLQDAKYIIKYAGDKTFTIQYQADVNTNKYCTASSIHTPEDSRNYFTCCEWPAVAEGEEQDPKAECKSIADETSRFTFEAV